MDHSEQKVSSEEVGQMNMSMNKMSVELDKVFFKVNLTLLSTQGCTSSKSQQMSTKGRNIYRSAKKSAILSQGQQFLQLSQKAISKNYIC